MSEPERGYALLLCRMVGEEDGKIIYGYYPLTVEQAVEQSHSGKLPEDIEAVGAKSKLCWFPRLANSKAGQIISVNYNVEKTVENGKMVIYINTAQYINTITNKDLVAQWQAEEQAFLNNFRNQQRLKKERSINHVYINLKPLREAYRATTSADVRRQMLADVIRYITG